MQSVGFFSGAVLIAAMFYGSATAEVLHPLDGLSGPEYTTVTKVLTEAGKIDARSRLALVNLAEPDKQAVLGWKSGDDLNRRAFVAVRHQRQLYEAIVNITIGELESWRHIVGAQPALMDTEWLLSQAIVRKDADWKAAVAKRGINFKTVFCFPVFPGFFGLPRDAENTRLGMVSCYDSGSENGLWGRPVSGLLAIVDYDERKVVELIDTGVVPIPAGGPPVNPDQPDDQRPTGPARQRLTFADNWVSWDKWRFHLRVDPRVGPMLSQASINDKGTWRSVMYQGSISELFVPYMDPSTNWYFRTYLDVGEYGIGTSGVPLRLGKDCPVDGILVDTAFMNELGKIYTKEGIVCLFERETGDAIWSHYEITQKGSQLRRRTELVVRFIVWLGNYDYILDWVFDETGAITIRVSSTGIVQIKAVNAQNMAANTAAADSAYGRLIAPGTVAVNHDHYFNFRLDMDVDGPANNMLIDRLRKVELNPDDLGTPRKQIWQIFPELLLNEADAKLNVNFEEPAVWRTSNPTVTNWVGNVSSYQLVPGGATRPLMDSDEVAHRRAAFTDYNLWVTPYKADERYAAGMYPNRHPGNAGLPTWTESNRSIKNTDIVLWYTLGMHHVVRAEDWPIMPVVKKEFELRPFDFFDHNPTVD